MYTWTEVVLVTLVVSDLALLGLASLGASIRTVALQGVLLGLFTLLDHGGVAAWRVALLVAASMILKGGALPWLLLRTLRGTGVRREPRPLVGYLPSLASGLAMLGICLWLGPRLDLARPGLSALVVPVALSTVLCGLFLLVTRRQAVNQVLGYLVFENGIYLFGVALVGSVPALVELGVLLDVFVAALVMGTAIRHLSRELEHMDTDRLNTLKD